ncbi:hypothetical protein BJY01DRAFT_250296 [Aspergillus pseudoustus]|uniref:Ankyrin repeat-containing domain protein n=1 Tax=Aspergillus pseudoustus TaxID=1810923 RepID=A0ABR4JIE8_9EURO
MSQSKAQSFLECLELSTRTNPRYQWLLSYLRHDRQFLAERIRPLVPGRTRTIVADFVDNKATPPIIFYPDDLDDLESTLANRPAPVLVRLILVVGVSGVDEGTLTQKPFTLPAQPSVLPDDHAPVLTRARTAGLVGSHPLRGHVSCLPQPDILTHVAAATRLDPGVILRHLDQREHLVYRARSQSLQQAMEGQARCLNFSLGVDQGNYITAALQSENLTWMRKSLILLANEDSCLGIDFNKFASAVDQVFQPSGLATPLGQFEAILRSKDERGRQIVLDNPLSLVWDYSAGLCSAFASHLELYRRKWEILYQAYANTSAVYGNVQSREYVRREAIELGTHLQYMQRSLQSLMQTIPEGKEKKSRSDLHSSSLDTVIQDFEQMSADVERLKLSYDAFIEQMVSKISLAEARTSMTEARDLQRLSYLGFVFAPLSLASSFFSINIRPLGGSAPVWAFVVTSLAILSLSILILFLLNPKVRNPLGHALGTLRSYLSAARAEVTHSVSLPRYEHDDPQKRTASLSITNSEGGTMMRIPPSRDVQRPNTMMLQTDNAQADANRTPRIRQLAVTYKKARTAIPNNDKERHSEAMKQKQRTAAHQPPIREEFPDPAMNIVFPSIKGLPAWHPLEHPMRQGRSLVSAGQLVSQTASLANATMSASLVNVQGALSEEVVTGVGLSNTETEITATNVIRTSTVLHGVPRSLDSDSRLVAAASESWSLKKEETPRAHQNIGHHAEAGSPSDDGMPYLHDGLENDVLSRSDPKTGLDQASYTSDDSYPREASRTISQAGTYKRPDFSRLDTAVNDIAWHIKLHMRFNYDTTWSPDARDIMIAMAISSLCAERDLREILILISTAESSDHNFDGLYAWGLAEAARFSFLEALPIFYNVIKHPDAQVDGLDRALQKAIGDSEEQLATMRWLWRRGAPVNLVRAPRDDPITIASQGGYEKALRLLMEWGADPKVVPASSSAGSLPLQEASKAGHTGIVNILLGAGVPAADPDAVGNAAKSGSLDVLIALVAAGAPIFGRGSSGQYGDPLCLAAAYGQQEVVSYILGLGARLDEPLGEPEDDSLPKELRGDEALFTAARDGGPSSEVICLMLLDSGVEPMFSRAYHDTPSRSTAHVAYTLAAMGGKIPLLTRILTAGADPNAVAPTYMTIRDLTRRAGNGMDVEDAPDSSMLALACAAGRAEAAKLLLQYGADVHYGGDISVRGTTPLHIAAKNGRVDMIDLLIAHGADILGRTAPGGAMPIHLAAAAGFTGCVQYLLDRGGDGLLEARDEQGQTPVIVAARQGNLSVIGVLLDKGASLTARDNEGWTAAHRAAWNGHEETMRLLVDRGADPEAETDSGLKIEDLLRHAEEDAGLAPLEEFL